MPLSDEMRPQNLSDFVGQEHLVGEGKPLKNLIENKEPISMIFWGPPGVGKTTLARIIARETSMNLVQLSAVSAGKADVRRVVEKALEPQIRLAEWGEMQEKQLKSRRTVLFLDEIHRFNKAQQDYLLPYVEDGTLVLIGATTENPSFSVIAPLLSRVEVFVLEELNLEELKTIVRKGLARLGMEMEDAAIEHLIRQANGDARKALNLLENIRKVVRKDQDEKGEGKIRAETLDGLFKDKRIRYDRLGEEHYDTVSAYIKSMRAGDVDASLYYLARMVEGGEDPLFIARRMVIFASEDIGMAQPTALVVANEVFRACEVIGYPECQINLAHGTVYLALAKKDRSAYEAYFRARDDVKEFGNLEIPKNLRNAPTKLMKELGYGKDYEMYPKEKKLLPDQLKGSKYYR